jgi:large subunit ribosomal protein L5e
LWSANQSSQLFLLKLVEPLYQKKKMVFVKVQKNKAYFKRFQTKYRRRRLGKTDYYARKRMVKQAKNKYNTPRYRFVVRFTNKYVICQVVYSLKDSDRIMCCAYSSELPRYGLPVGLKNYSAAYATGLLCARRLLSKLSVTVDGAEEEEKVTLASLYPGTAEVSGEIETDTDESNKRKYFVNELHRDEDGEVRIRPFRCFLDVGIQRTTKGCRIFGALKGAVDGGLDIPHNEKLFPGYTKEDGQIAYDAEEHKDKIMGASLGEYMEELMEEDEEKYNSLFAMYIKHEINSDNLTEKIEECHAAIRANPAPKHDTNAKTRSAAGHPNRAASKEKKNALRLTYEARKARVQAKKEAVAAYLMAEE